MFKLFFQNLLQNFFSGKAKQFAITGILFAIVFPFLPFTLHRSLFLDVGIMILTYIMLGWGLNIVVGLAGLT
jgi:branched-chain amino acid transport system permease protein